MLSMDYFHIFVFSGRVSESSTLFTYLGGKTYSDYNDLSFTPNFIDPSNLPTDATATAICGSNQACLYDYMTTQDRSFAQETINLVIEFEQAQNDTQEGKLLYCFLTILRAGYRL